MLYSLTINAGHPVPRFLDLAGHYGLVPRACRPARAQTKGTDERNVGDVTHHCFVRYRAFDSWAHLTQLAERWLRDEADRRIHGTVYEVVAERFAREAPTLRPLPSRHDDTAYWESRQVGWDTYIDVRGSRYSVPAALAGQRVTVQIALDGVVSMYEDEQLLAQHALQAGAPPLGHGPGASRRLVGAYPRGRAPASGSV
jgi:hypothetical protein